MRNNESQESIDSDQQDYKYEHEEDPEKSDIKNNKAVSPNLVKSKRIYNKNHAKF